MAFGFPPELGTLAFLEGLGEAAYWVGFAVRVFLALAAALLMWFLGGPIVSLLWRAAFQSKPSSTAYTLGRLGLSGTVGFLVFLLVGLGGGGLGFGFGGGGGFGFGKGSGEGEGTAKGTGLGTGKGTGSEHDPATQKGTGPTDKDTPKEKKETLRVELVTEASYTGGKRYFLIDGKQPGVTAEELDALLKKNPGRWGRMEIIRYRNSLARAYRADEMLEALADRHKLIADTPPEYRNKDKLSPE
jgi:hypothetical protein